MDTALWGCGRVLPLPRAPEDRAHDALAAFLLARFEDEDGIAGSAWITRWRQPSSGSWIVVDDHSQQVANCQERDIARHISNWHPLRVLDHVDARRLIVDAYEDAPAHSPQWQTLRQALCLLTWPYADHPDWDPAWEQHGKHR